jgi:hypothetical protein
MSEHQALVQQLEEMAYKLPKNDQGDIPGAVEYWRELPSAVLKTELKYLTKQVEDSK